MHIRSLRSRARVTLGLILVVGGPLACIEDLDAGRPLFMPYEHDGGSVSPAVALDQVEIVRGVLSRGRDPAVVAIDVGGEGICSGALVAENVVLTARHCVARTLTSITCPAPEAQVQDTREPSTLRVLGGEEVARASIIATARSIVAPNGLVLCDSDVAFLVLDRAIDGIVPLSLRFDPVVVGEHVRAVGFGRRSDEDGAGLKLVREHVRITDVTAFEFSVGEATCQGDSGGPAIDENSGEIVGVVSRGGPSCEGPNVHNRYTRVDVYRALYEEALRRAAESSGVDAGVKAPPRGTKPKPQTDMGKSCAGAVDCATGVCIVAEASGYCSRKCGTGDRCPNGYRCKPFRRGAEPAVSACARNG